MDTRARWNSDPSDRSGMLQCIWSVPLSGSVDVAAGLGTDPTSRLVVSSGASSFCLSFRNQVATESHAVVHKCSEVAFATASLGRSFVLSFHSEGNPLPLASSSTCNHLTPWSESVQKSMESPMHPSGCNKGNLPTLPVILVGPCFRGVECLLILGARAQSLLGIPHGDNRLLMDRKGNCSFSGGWG